jgi:hypothetical protein
MLKSLKVTILDTTLEMIVLIPEELAHWRHRQCEIMRNKKNVQWLDFFYISKMKVKKGCEDG